MTSSSHPVGHLMTLSTGPDLLENNLDSSNDSDADYMDSTEYWHPDENMEHANGPLATAIIVTVYIFIQIFSLIGNALVLYIAVKGRKLRSITNFFLGNLALADLIVSVFCMPYLLLMIVLENWPWGEIWCKVYGFARGFSHCAATTVLVLIAVERFLAICHPFTGRKFLMSPTSLRRTAVVVWSCAAFAASPNAYFFRTFTHEFSGKDIPLRNQTICYRDYSLPNHQLILPIYDVCLFFFFYIVPAMSMVVLYCIAGRRLWSSATDATLGFTDSNRHVSAASRGGSYSSSVSAVSSRHSSASSSSTRTSGGGRPIPAELRSLTAAPPLPAGPTPPDSPVPFQLHRKPIRSVSAGSSLTSRRSSSTIVDRRLRVIRMLMIIVSVFLVCWLPVHLRKFAIYMKGWSSEDGWSWLGSFLLPLSDWLVNVNSALNPIIYALFSDQFRESAYELLALRRKKSPFVRGNRGSAGI